MLPRRSKDHLLFGLMLSGLLLVGQLSTLVHLALVRHVTCPEHGELVHASDDAQAVSAARKGLSVRAVPRGVDHHGHDHCLICTPRREDSLAAPEAHAALLAPVARPVSVAADAAPASRSVALLRLAPKNSPPA